MTIAFGKYGEFAGKTYLFTHRDPRSGKVWSDELIAKDGNLGRWLYPHKVKWVDSK